jgi:hypothetical protein
MQPEMYVGFVDLASAATGKNDKPHGGRDPGIPLAKPANDVYDSL